MEGKTIRITGKKTIDALHGAPGRRASLPAQEDFSGFDERRQVAGVNMLFLGESFEHKETLQKELQRKIVGYRAQDKRNSVLDPGNVVSVTDVVELLVESKLKCFYCYRFVPVLFEAPNDPSQWTLDRIDNDQGHNLGNVKISCLACNVKRGATDMAKFKEGRVIRVNKQK